MTLRFYDAAYPPSPPPAADGVCFYIGGDAYHIWTEAELRSQTARYRLPVFVRSDPSAASATMDVTEAVTALHAYGAPTGTLVAWDMETAIDAGYIRAAYRGLKAAGYIMIVYGTQSDVLQNDNPDDLYWGAEWTGTAHFANRDQMTQYVSFPSYDESIAESTLPFWDTHRTTTTTATPPAAEPDWQVNMMRALPDLQEGATGSMVRTVQALCQARGQHVTIDGNFGPQTKLGVEAVQKANKITADGVVGPQTWPFLVTGP